MKDINKHNKTLYSITKKPVSRREIKKIKKIREKSSKKGSNSSSDDSDSNSLLARNSSRDTFRRPARRKEMNILDHIVTENLKNNKYQINEAINSDPKFDTSNFNLSSGTSNPLLVVTVSIRGGNKHRATTVAGLTCLWDNGATNSTIKRRHTMHYKRNMRPNKAEYSIAAGAYCTTHALQQ